MRFLIQHIRLFLIIAMVLSPVQHLFAMQAGMPTGAPVVAAETAAAMAVETVSASDAAQNSMPAMLDEDCSKHGKNGNCQGSNQCGSCPVSLGASQISPRYAELSTQTQPALSDVSLNSANLLPDYRPPRYS
jgi:ferredoxin